MRLYSVHLPSATTGDEALGGAVFVRDGFHFWAFVLPVLWCLWRGLWLAALAIVAARGVLLGLGHVLGMSFMAQMMAQLVLSILVGLEAANLRRWALGRRGYAEAGMVAATNFADAEERFFARTAAQPIAVARPPAAALAPTVPTTRAGEDVIGLFPEPGGR